MEDTESEEEKAETEEEEQERHELNLMVWELECNISELDKEKVTLVSKLDRLTKERTKKTKSLEDFARAQSSSH